MLPQYEAHGRRSFPRDLSSLRQNGKTHRMSNGSLIDAALACESSPCHYSGYSFHYWLIGDAEGTERYVLTAQPDEFGRTGTRSFYTDESGVIRYTNENRPATQDDPPLP
jgi:hypothetical protein